MTATTINRTSYNTEPRPLNLAGVVNAPLWQYTFPTTQLDEVGDTVNMGNLPPRSNLTGFFIGADDIDGGTALVWKIQANGVDIRTGITIGQAASNVTNSLTQFVGIRPMQFTADTLISIVITTPAGTPVQGDIWIQPVYVGF